MSLSKSKCWYSNDCLHLLKRAVVMKFDCFDIKNKFLGEIWCHESKYFKSVEFNVFFHYTWGHNHWNFHTIDNSLSSFNFHKLQTIFFSNS